MGPLLETEAVGWALRLVLRVEEMHRGGAPHGAISADAIEVSGHTPSSPACLLGGAQAPSVPGCHSPERLLLGSPSMADDVWAVGATLYFLLTGSLPYGTGSEGEVRQRIAQSAPAPLSVFGVDDEEIQRILDRLLARQPGQRFGRITELRDTLRAWCAAAGVTELAPLDPPRTSSSTVLLDDDEDDEVATQMRDVGDIQALLAAAQAGPAFSPPPNPAPIAAPTAPPGRADQRRGTMLGIGSPLAMPSPAPTLPPSVPDAPVPPAFSGPSSVTSTSPASPALSAPVAPSPAEPAFSAPAPVAPARPAAREIQPTMRSLGVPPELLHKTASPVLDADDDEDDGGGATLMLDVGPLDVNAAIAEALNRAGGAAHTVPLSGAGPAAGDSSAVDQFLDRPWQSGGAGTGPVSPVAAPSAAPMPGAAFSGGGPASLGPAFAPPQGAMGHAPPSFGTPVPYGPPAAGPVVPAASSEGRGLKIALAVGVVLLVIVVAAVVVLYLRQRG